MKNKNFIRKRQAIYISPNKKSTRIIKTLMNFFFFIKVKIKMVCFSVPSRCSTVPRRETPAITNCCNMSVLVTLRKYRKIVISHCASFSSITFTISLNYFFLHHITLQEDGFRIPKYFHTQAGNVG